MFRRRRWPRVLTRERENVGQEGFDALVHRVCPRRRLPGLLAHAVSASETAHNSEVISMFMTSRSRHQLVAADLGDEDGGGGGVFFHLLP